MRLLLAVILGLLAMAGSVEGIDTDRSSATDLWRKHLDTRIFKSDRRPNMENYKPSPNMFPSVPDSGVNSTPFFGVGKLNALKGKQLDSIGTRYSELGLRGDGGNMYTLEGNIWSGSTLKAREEVLKFLEGN